MNCVGVLDLGPVAALGEDVHPRIRHHPGELQPHIQRAEAVIHAPDREQLGLQFGKSPIRFSRGISPCFLPNSSTVSGSVLAL